MARIIYRHPRQSKYDYHIFTDLDFWDTRRILKNLVTVKRNFGSWPPGDEFPTQAVGVDLDRAVIKEVERRLSRAIVSPARHVIVQSMIFQGFFEFDPSSYYPERWSERLRLQFTYRRLPLDQAVLNNPYQTVRIRFVDGGKIRIDRIQRAEKFSPIIRTIKDAERRAHVPSCF